MSDTAPLSDLLDSLHAALIAGKFDQLAALEQAIRDACARLPRDPALAATLRAKAQRNDRLLAASLRGLRAARRRIAELQALDAGHATYDPGGRKQHLPLQAAQLSRRF